MKDSEIIKHIYKNNYRKDIIWCEWELLDQIDFSLTPKQFLDEFSKVLVIAYENYILMNYKFYNFRPDYASMRKIEKLKTTYMIPVTKFRQKYNYYKPLKLK